MGESVTPVSPARIDRAETAFESFKRKEEKIIGLRVDTVGRVTGDVPVASSIALGALKNLVQLRPDFEKLNDEGAAVQALDELEDVALAAFYTHVQYTVATETKALAPLLDRGRVVREDILRNAESLMRFGHFTEAAVAAIREGAGHLDLAKDLINLAALYSSNWEQLINKVPFDLDLVNEAAQLGPQLLRAIGAEEVGEIRRDPSLDWGSLRARAFRLLVITYEELQRAVTYVRWYQADARSFAPALHPRTVTSPGKPATTPSQAPNLPSAEQVLGVSTPPLSGVAPGLKGSAPFAAE